jgi:hypothetical protein
MSPKYARLVSFPTQALYDGSRDHGFESHSGHGCLVSVYRLRPCDELITRPWSLTECLRSSNRSETESFMEVGQGPNWGCSAKGKIMWYIHILITTQNVSVNHKKSRDKPLVCSWLTAEVIMACEGADRCLFRHFTNGLQPLGLRVHTVTSRPRVGNLLRERCTFG